MEEDFKKLNIPTECAYYTHAPYLFNACKRAISKNKNARFLELGMGHGSGPIFAHFLNQTEAQLDTYETEHEWYLNCTEKYYKNYSNVNHAFHDNFEQKYESILTKKYDLIFVDQGSWEDRDKTLNLLLNNTDCFVVHDYDYNMNRWVETDKKLKEHFTNFIFHNETAPPTLVCYL